MSTPGPSESGSADIMVRLATEEDFGAVQRLFDEGLLEGQLRDNDTGADIENLREGYFSDDGASAFWVATCNDEIVGMIGVQRTRADTAEVRRLRVSPDHRRRGIGSMLMETATRFCEQQGYLKVVLDVRVERGPAIAMFGKFGFRHVKTREIEGRKTLDFFLDLYRGRE